MSTQSSLQNSNLECRQRSLMAWDICAGIVPALAVLPMMVGQGIELWRLHQTKIGLLVWVFLLVAVAVRARGVVSRHKARMIAAVCLLLAGVSCLIYGLLQWSLASGQVAAACFLAAWGLGRCSERRWHEPLSWSCLLLLTVPLPTLHVNFDNWLTDWSAATASGSLDALSVPNVYDRGIFSLEAGQFSAGAVTSAKLGLYAAWCATAVWCWVWSRSLFHSALLMLGAALCAVITRYAAILTVTYGLVNYQSDWTATTQSHYAIVIVTFAVMLLLVVLLDRLLLTLLQPIPSANPDHVPLFTLVNSIFAWPKSDEVVPEDLDEMEEFQTFKAQIDQWHQSWYSVDWQSTRWLRVVTYSVAVTCAVVLVTESVAAIRGGLVEPRRAVAELKLEPLRNSITIETLPAKVENLQRAGFGTVNDQASGQELPEQGKFGARWIYLWNGLTVQVELAAPLQEWSRPALINLSKAGTEQVDLRGVGASEDWPWYECRQVNLLGGDAYLLQCCMADDQEHVLPLEAAPSGSLPLIAKLIGERRPARNLYDVRVYCESGRPLTAIEQKELQLFFEKVRIELRKVVPAGLLSNNLVAS